MRIDKFLWCARLCRSRTIASEQCAKECVRLNDRAVKASVEVRVGDMISVRQAPVWRVFEVIAMPASRVGAKLVHTLIADRTPFEDLEKQEIARKVRTQQRDIGEGRPTKRERRDIGYFLGEA